MWEQWSESWLPIVKRALKRLQNLLMPWPWSPQTPELWKISFVHKPSSLWDFVYICLSWATVSCFKKPEQKEASVTARGNENVTAPLEDSCQFYTKLIIFLWYNSTTMLHSVYLSKLKIYVHTNLYMNVYSSFTHNCKNMKIMKNFFTKWMDKQSGVNPNNGLLLSN